MKSLEGFASKRHIKVTKILRGRKKVSLRANLCQSGQSACTGVLIEVVRARIRHIHHAILQER